MELSTGFEIACCLFPKSSPKPISNRSIRGLSVPSNHIIGSLDPLKWSCQVQLGVVMRSPLCIGNGSPSTVVCAPAPSTTNRIAPMVCRCASAISPGLTSCTPRAMVWVVLDLEGLLNAINLLKDRPRLKISPALWRALCTSFHRHMQSSKDEKGSKTSVLGTPQ